MWTRFERELPQSAGDCYRWFCGIDELPQWVPRVLSVDIRTRHPDGSPAVVAFEALGPGNARLSYALSYSFNRDQLKVAWHPRVAERHAVRGYATFQPKDAGRCLMTYALSPGGRWGNDPGALERMAEDVVDAFEAWVKTQAQSRR